MHTAHFVVRLLCPDDAKPYQLLRLRGLQDHPDAFTSSVEQDAGLPLSWAQQRLTPDAGRPHDFFLGAVDDAGALVGMVGLQAQYRSKSRHNATLVGLFVPRERAGAGIGRALVQQLVERATDLPVLQQIDLTLTAGNRRAQSLYEHSGFAVVGVWPRAIQVDGVYHDKLRMQLQLRGHASAGHA